MKKRAFTLFELLVSISIIGILIAVASTSYGAAQKKARDARRIEDMNAIQKAAEMYYSQNNYVYPTQVQLVGSSLIQQWPVDPKGTSALVSYRYNPIVESGVNIGYCACAYLDITGSGNSSNTSCSSSGTLNYYCVKNQQ